MGAGKGSTSTSTSGPPKEVLEEYKNVINQAKQVAAKPLEQYTGATLAGFTPMQQAAFQNVNNAQNSYQPYFDAASGLVGQATQQYTPQAFSGEAIQGYMNPYTQSVIDSTMANINQENAKQQNSLQGNAISSGAWGGNRADLARNDLARQQALASGQVIAGLNNQNYNQAVNQFNTMNQTGQNAAALNSQNALSGASQFGNLGNSAVTNALNGATAQYGMGQAQQGLVQQQLNAPYEQFQQQQQYPFQTTQWLSNLVQGIGGNMGGTSSTTTPGPSTISQIGGAALGIAGLFSDKRVKEDISRVGELDNGLPVYTFKYKGDNKTQMGLMAQDVEKQNPDAVGSIGGIKTVDYKSAAMAAGGVPDQSQSFIPDTQTSGPIGASSIPAPPAPTQPEETGVPDMGALDGIVGKMKTKHNINSDLDKAFAENPSIFGGNGGKETSIQDWARGGNHPNRELFGGEARTAAGIGAQLDTAMAQAPDIFGGSSGNMLAGLKSFFGWADGGEVSIPKAMAAATPDMFMPASTSAPMAANTPGTMHEVQGFNPIVAGTPVYATTPPDSSNSKTISTLGSSLNPVVAAATSNNKNKKLSFRQFQDALNNQAFVDKYNSTYVNDYSPTTDRKILQDYYKSYKATPFQFTFENGGHVEGYAGGGLTNYNIGNLRAPGQTTGFRKFSTPEDGLAAMQADIGAKISGNSPAMKNRYGESYVPTIESVITTYAPPSENNTAKYIEFVSAKTGIDPTKPLTMDDLNAIVPAMAQMENGAAAGDFARGMSEKLSPNAQAMMDGMRAAGYNEDAGGITQGVPQAPKGSGIAQVADSGAGISSDANPNLPDALNDLKAELDANAPEIDKGMALSKAGFSMMAGTSPFAGVNIGQGAVAGLNDYATQKKAASDYKIKSAEALRKAKNLAGGAGKQAAVLQVFEQFEELNNPEKDPIKSEKNLLMAGKFISKDSTIDETGKMIPMTGAESTTTALSAADEKGKQAEQIAAAGPKKANELEAVRIAEIKKSRPFVRNALEAKKSKTAIVKNAISLALSKVDGWTSGLMSLTDVIPGTPAADLKNTLATIKANIGFSELQAMRDASPTGGALGQVSERENQYLQSLWASLENSQSPEQLKHNLSIVQEETDRAWQRVQDAYEREYGSDGSSGAKYKKGDKKSGYTFIGEDGADWKDKNNWKKD